jgi:hypothetical protein
MEKKPCYRFYFAYMVSNGGMLDESTYIILIEGLAYEGFRMRQKNC